MEGKKGVETYTRTYAQRKKTRATYSSSLLPETYYSTPANRFHRANHRISNEIGTKPANAMNCRPLIRFIFYDHDPPSAICIPLGARTFEKYNEW